MFNFFYMWLHVFLPPAVHKTVQVNPLTAYIVNEVSPIVIGIDLVEFAALCQGVCEGKVLGGIVTSAEKEVLASAGKVSHALLGIVVVHPVSAILCILDQAIPFCAGVVDGPEQELAALSCRIVGIMQQVLIHVVQDRYHVQRSLFPALFVFQFPE